MLTQSNNSYNSSLSLNVPFYIYYFISSTKRAGNKNTDPTIKIGIKIKTKNDIQNDSNSLYDSLMQNIGNPIIKKGQIIKNKINLQNIPQHNFHILICVLKI